MYVATTGLDKGSCIIACGRNLTPNHGPFVTSLSQYSNASTKQDQCSQSTRREWRNSSTHWKRSPTNRTNHSWLLNFNHGRMLLALCYHSYCVNIDVYIVAVSTYPTWLSITLFFLSRFVVLIRLSELTTDIVADALFSGRAMSQQTPEGAHLSDYINRVSSGNTWENNQLHAS